MSNTPDNTDDVIDSRDIIARIEELEGERDGYEIPEDARESDTDESRELWAEANPQDAEELASLLALQSEAECSPDWVHGETLISEGYFTKYIEELIDDCYEMPKALNSGEWPWRHVAVDYEAAAEEAKVDYMEVDFDGTTYLIRV